MAESNEEFEAKCLICREIFHKFDRKIYTLDAYKGKSYKEKLMAIFEADAAELFDIYRSMEFLKLTVNQLQTYINRDKITDEQFEIADKFMNDGSLSDLDVKVWKKILEIVKN